MGIQTPNLTETLRQSVISVLGAPPDPAPLLPTVLEVTTGPGYRCEHIKYQVHPNDWSYAYLLIPEGLAAPAPVIYCHHQHHDDFTIGKSEIFPLNGNKMPSRKDALGLELVRRGYVVFAPDAIGYGERRSPESDGPAYDVAYNFHQLALRLLRGETLLRKVIWDVSRGIDYLETRTEIHPHYIGFLGQGYGGKMAIWAMALEPRIRAGVAHCGVVTYRQNVKRGDWFQVEFVVPRLMQVADLYHILTLVAPRPFLLSTTAGDPDSADAYEIYQRALAAYEKHGVANRLTFYRYMSNKSNVFEQHMRHNTYNWLDCWLKPF